MPKSTDAKRQAPWGHMRLKDEPRAEKSRRYTLEITIWASNGKTLARRIRRFADAMVKSQLGGSNG